MKLGGILLLPLKLKTESSWEFVNKTIENRGAFNGNRTADEKKCFKSIVFPLFNSPELKAQVKFSDHFLSGVEGVSDYFFRHPQYSKVAVKYFPLDIMRPYEFPVALENILQEIIQRLKQEILKGLQAVLSCKIFEKK